MAWQGQAIGWVSLGLPYVLGVLFYFWLPRAARAGWYRATSVLADIDARYGVLSDTEEALRVYMDWTLRFMPERLAFWALKDMRYGWRARRSWVALTWLIGLLGIVAGWTQSEDGPIRVLVMMALGVAIASSLPGMRSSYSSGASHSAWPKHWRSSKSLRSTR